MSAFAGLVEELRRDPQLGPEVGELVLLPPEPERPADLSPPLPERLSAGLEARGVRRLWTHQVAALEAVRAGENVLVTTPTASGKSLVFQLPVLEEALTGGPGRALFLYPLKALAQDQRAKLEGLAAAAGIEAPCAVYDGDTPPRERQRIRRHPPRVLISNPDMLHLGILGGWAEWADLLRDLRWVVLDELHVYRGIFGCHFHHVLERLRRVCRAEASRPLLIASSATAANAGEFAAALAGGPFRWIAGSGAPRAGRGFLTMRPVASPYTTALRLLAKLIEWGSKTIVFTKARRITELLHAWLLEQRPDLAGRVASYRSGFLPEERRDIERRLASGKLDGVVATSALELGIDIGGLDACVLVGFPGSVMATWQRSGRVGRAGRESLTALVPLPDALDQYFVDHPLELLSRPCEGLFVDPANPGVARAQLLCAAAELPLDCERDAPYLERHADAVEVALERGELAPTRDGRRLQARVGRPHREVDLRGTGGSTAIVESDSGRLVGTVDGARVLRETHPGAIYFHAGRQYLVRTLDLGASRVLVEPTEVEYFTTPRGEKETEILETLAERGDGELAAGLGRLRVTERIVGFERKRLHGQETIDVFDLELPPIVFETVGLWWLASGEMEERLRLAGRHVMGALHASEHAAISLIPLLAVCDRGDLGGISQPRHPELESAAVFVYDAHAGGIGIAAKVFERLPELLGRVLDLIRRCPCEDGCPSCIHSPKCGNGNRPLDKAGATELLGLLLRPPTARSTPVGGGPPPTRPRRR